MERKTWSELSDAQKAAVVIGGTVEVILTAVAAATRELLAEFPERLRPPATEPPLRRRAAAAMAGDNA